MPLSICVLFLLSTFLFSVSIYVIGRHASKVMIIAHQADRKSVV